MPAPDSNQSERWSDEIVQQPAGAESATGPAVDMKDPGALTGAAMPPVTRYLDETGELPSLSFGDWQGTWIEDA